MHKRAVILFILMLSFGLVVSTEIDIQHIIGTLIITLVILWLWRDLDPKMPVTLSLKGFFVLGHCLILLAWYIIESNISVARVLLFSKSAINPSFVIIQPKIRSNWGRILLATCITITPGTVTVDIDPDTGEFTVHAITEQTAKGLVGWKIINIIKKMESYMEKGGEQIVDVGRTYDFNSSGTDKRDYRSNRH